MSSHCSDVSRDTELARIEDGTAEEMGWTLLKEKKGGKATVAVKNKNSNLLRHSRRSMRWYWLFLEVSSFCRCTCHTCSGEANLEEYYKTLKDLVKNLQDVKQKYHLWHHCWSGCACRGEAATGAISWKWHEKVPLEHHEIL